MGNPPELVFLHIPKTAGNSVLNALKPMYKPSEIAPFIIEGRTDTSGWPHYKFIAGHMGFDMAQTFRMNMIAVVRDPIERTISLYNFWRTGNTGMRDVLKGMTFEHFLKSDHPTAVVNRDNTQTWQLAYSLEPKRQRSTPLKGDALLEQAITNLNKLAIVGVTEHLDKFISRFHDVFDVELPVLPHANKTKRRPQADQLSAEAVELIYKCTELDRRLYQYVLSVI